MDRIQSLETRTIKTFSILALIHMAIFGVLSYTVDSEIWSVNLAQYLGHPESQQFSAYNKPVFYFLLKLIYLLPLGDLQTLIAAKVMFTLNGLVLTYLCFKVFERLTESKEIAWAGLFFLMINPTWITECFRIRADLLGMTFSLCGLYWALGKTIAPGFRKTALIFLCFLISSFCTPKSIIWNFPILLFLLVGGDLKIEKKRLPVFVGTLLGLMAILGTVYQTSDAVHQAIAVAWRHFSETWSLSSFESWIDFNMSWILVFNSIMASPVIWTLVLTPVFLIPWVPKNGWSQRKKLGFTLMQAFLLISFIFYPAKTLFFWAAMLPLFILPSILVLQKFFGKTEPRARVAVITLAIIFFGYQMIEVDQQQNGFSSYQLIGELERFGVGRRIRIFDSMGLLPRTAQIPLYVGYGDEVGNAIAVQTLLKNPPDILFNSTRIQNFVPQLLEELKKTGKFEEIQNDLWLKTSSFNDHPKPPLTGENISVLFNQRVLWKP